MINVGTLGISFFQSAGWKLIEDYVNQKDKYGLYTKDGNPFYEGLIEYDNHVNFLNNPLNNPFKINGKDINPLTGKVVLGNKNSARKNLVEAGVDSVTVNLNSEITNAPIENGGFVLVNKVNMPSEFNINYLVTGTEKQRKYMMDAALKAKKSKLLFYLYFGEVGVIAKTVNVTGVTINRTPQSAQLFNILIQVKEVRNMVKRSDPLENATAYHGSSQNIGDAQTQKASGLQKQIAKKQQV